MKTEKYKLDETKLTTEQRKELDNYRNTQKQLDSLKDIADIAQELVHVTDDTKKVQGMQMDKLGAVMTDAREQLVKLNKKETTFPDFSKPVVEAVAKLEKALKAIEVKPSVTVSAPEVNVPKLDLTEFNKVLKTEMPKAFDAAIKGLKIPEIPKTDNSDLLAAWEGISEQLVSIEHATRLKPQMPTTLKVTNVDGTAVGGGESTRWALYEDARQDLSSDPMYFGKEDASGNWVIKQFGITSTLTKYYEGTGGISSNWAGRAGYTYVEFNAL